MLIQQQTHVLDIFSCGTVDYPGQPLTLGYKLKQARIPVRRMLYGKIQIRTVEACRDLQRILKLKAFHDILADPSGCRCRKRPDDRTGLQL